MKKSRLLTTLLVAASAALTLSACGQTTNAKDDSVVKVGMLQQVNQIALDKVRKGFTSEMAKLGFDDKKLEIHYQNANGDQSNLRSMSEKLASEGNAVNIAIATAAAQAMARADTKTPILFTGVANPEATGLIKDGAHPDKNATGVAAVTDEDDQIELLHKMFPKAKRIGMLFDAAEPNSQLHVANAKKAMARLNLTPVEKTVTSTNDVKSATEALVKSVDAVYLPADNSVASAMPTVGRILDAAHIPAVPGDATMVKLAGVATRGIDFTAVGRQTAQMAVKVIKGQKVKDTPVEGAKVTGLVVNQKRMKAFGLTEADLK